MATTKEMEKFFKELGLRIANQRRAVGLTQTDLADAIGCSQQLVAHYEAGRRRIPASALSDVCKALKFSLHELLGEEQPDARKQKPGPPSKLQLQIERIQTLPRAKQKFITEMIETVLAKAS